MRALALRLALLVAGLVVAIAARAESVVITYSYQVQSNPYTGNGYTSFASALSAGCAGFISGENTRNNGQYNATLNTCTATETTSPQIVNFTYTNRALPSGPDYAGNGNIIVTKFTSCPTAGWLPYTYAVGDQRCRPAFCAANVGKYFGASTAMGTTANPGTHPAAPDFKCSDACVANSVGGYWVGVVDPANAAQQAWVYNSTWRFNGEACVDRPGLGAQAGRTTDPGTSAPANYGTSGAAGGLTAQDSTVLSDVRTNTGDTKSAIDQLKTVVQAGQCGVEGKPACKVTMEEADPIETASVYAAMDDYDQSANNRIDSLKTAGLPQFNGQGSKPAWSLDAFFPVAGAKCKLERIWHFNIGGHDFGEFDIGPNYCAYEQYVHGFLYFCIGGFTCAYLYSLAYRK